MLPLVVFASFTAMSLRVVVVAPRTWFPSAVAAKRLAIAALSMALEARRPTPGSLIHHSDRGIQYACGDYTDLLDQHDIAASMSRIGYPYDNARAESFMKTLKQEEVNGQTYRDALQARNAIGVFIEDVYNRQRLHSALAYRPPAEFEENLPRCGAAAQQSRSVAPISQPAKLLQAAGITCP